MTAFDLIKDMFVWYSTDLIGNDIIAGLIILIVAFIGLSVIGLDNKLILPFMLPLSIGFIGLGYLSSWFGMIIIGFAGIVFGYLVYKLYN